MSEYIAFDSHKRYTWVDRQDHSTGETRCHRLEHAPGAVRNYLSGCEPGTGVAVEATGNWYWIIDEIEQAGLQPLLVHPRKAKLMMGQINKTDKLDAQGLNRLQRNGTLPTVWIPPGPLRDLRELTRTRLVLTAQRTRLKNRISATLAKYGMPASEYSDPYGKRGRAELEQHLASLPEQTRWVSKQLLAQLDFVNQQVRELEQRLNDLVEVTTEMQWLLTMPGIGVILAATIALEIGEVQRFPSAMHLASYAGTTPRVHASGGKVRYGPLRADVNRYLKWAFAEAANSVAVNHTRCPDRHVSQLYRRIRAKKGHPKAIGAVARHLAEAAFHVLRQKQMYRDPTLGRGCTSQR
ncbi:MAG TPA: IS110 family transposase [Candidatus Sulfotelmatobacter sp.]|jgi:transposase|nr:IS110 family transposase [Candidatus Sulfotelmatobacter sp.]